MIRMHSVIIQTPKCMQTDHRDGDGLNNQRSNLRVCTHAENTRNRGKHKTNKSGFKGVYLNKENKRWRAEIRSNGKKIFLGSYISKELAYKVYVEACKKYHREFSNIG